MNPVIVGHLVEIFTTFHDYQPKHWDSIYFACDVLDVCTNSIVEMLQDDYQAYGVDGWKPTVQALAEFLGKNPEDIFGLPLDIEFIKAKLDDIIVPTLPDAELLNLAVQELSREENGKILIDVILSRVVGDETLQEIGDRYQVTRERIRQQEARALKKLRYNFAAA